MMLALFSGCQSVRNGRSSFEVVDQPALVTPAAKASVATEISDSEVEYIRPSARRPLTTPVYPENALRASAGRCIVYVTISLDENGRVTDVVRNWRSFSTATPYIEDFIRAIREAAATWDIDPARCVYYRRSPSGERSYLRTEAIAENFDMKFSFEESKERPRAP